MLFILTAIIGIAAGMFTGGRLSNILDFNIKRAGLIIFAFVLLTASRLIGVKYPGIGDYNLLIHILVYALLLVGLWSNRHYAGIWFLGAGCLLNALVMGLNNGKMPVSAIVASKIGITPDAIDMDIRHMVFNDMSEIRAWFLSDIIRLPKVLGYGMQIVSTGDLVISAGVMLLMFQIVRGGKNGKRESVENGI